MSGSQALLRHLHHHAMAHSTHILWLRDGSTNTRALAGGKGSSLGAMIAAGFPVPPGFAVTTEAYRAFLRWSGLAATVCAALRQQEIGDTKRAAMARAAIETASLQGPIGDEVRHAYRRLCELRATSDVPVAVRSSSTCEDGDRMSFAGEHTTHLWVRGEDNVLAAVVSCWASLFTARTLDHSRGLGLPLSELAMAVVVQEMAPARAAGILFTLNPLNGDRSKIVIEASFGFGTANVQGEVDPDRYFIDKVTCQIVKRQIATKRIAYRVVDDRVRKVELEEGERAAPSLDDAQAIELARLGKALEAHEGCPLDIEWAVTGDCGGDGSVVLLQSRPETVWSRRPRTPVVTPAGSALGLVLSTMMEAGKKGRGVAR